MAQRPTLLAVLAHPDDESFGIGGTLSRYAHNGAEVHLIIATDGDAGSVDTETDAATGEPLAEIRQRELARAAEALGITKVWRLPYRDSGMRGSPDNHHPRALIQHPLETIGREIAEIIRIVRPQVVITHDLYGGYGHPDHIHVCRATTIAFCLAANPQERLNGSDLPPYAPQKLYYTAFDKRMLKWLTYIMPFFGMNPRAFGRNKDIDLVRICQWETPVHTRIDISDFLAHKERASQAHASQYDAGPTFMKLIPPFLRKRWAAVETFTRVFPLPNGRVETDLFEGVQLG